MSSSRLPRPAHRRWPQALYPTQPPDPLDLFAAYFLSSRLGYGAHDALRRGRRRGGSSACAPTSSPAGNRRRRRPRRAPESTRSRTRSAIARHDDLDHRDLAARLLVADRVHQVGRLHRQQPRLLDLHPRLGDVGADRALLRPASCRTRRASGTRRHIASSARSATPMSRMQWWMRPGAEAVPARSRSRALRRAACSTPARVTSSKVISA